MNKLIGVVGVIAVLVLSGCSNDYVMATKEGKVLITQGKPKMDQDTGLVAYTDQSGHQVQINSDDISSIIEK